MGLLYSGTVDAVFIRPDGEELRIEGMRTLIDETMPQMYSMNYQWGLPVEKDTAVVRIMLLDGMILEGKVTWVGQSNLVFVAE